MPYSFPFYHQLDAMDCGPTCLKMVAKHYGRSMDLDYLRQESCISREGVSMLGISTAAEKIGFRTLGVKVPFQKLLDEAPLPCILHWQQSHFVVLYAIRKKGRKVYIADPAHGLLTYDLDDFLSRWAVGTHEDLRVGSALLLEPTPDFFLREEDEANDKTKLSFVFKYLRPYKKYIIQLFLGMFLGTVLQLLFPFMTQSIVDFGIGNQNLSFVTLILIAQLTLFTAQTAVEFIRSWILLHISTVSTYPLFLTF